MSTEARVTGGQVVQAHTQARLEPVAARRRSQWSHYLSRPATIEVWDKKLRPTEIAEALFAQTTVAEGFLDLSGPSAHRLNLVRGSTLLDRRQRYRPEQIRLRWVATATTGQPAVVLTLLGPRVHTLRLQVPAEVLPLVQELCLDIALHDWLLSSVLDLIEKAGIGSRSRAQVVSTLAPAIDHLLHAWLPGARLPDSLTPFWAEIERLSGMSRQWTAAVARTRDQVSLAAVEQAHHSSLGPSSARESA